MNNAALFKITSIPAPLDAKFFVESFLGNSFAIYHDIKNGGTYLVMDDVQKARLCSAMPGISMDNASSIDEFGDPSIFVFYTMPESHADKREAKPQLFSDAYKIFKNAEMNFCVSFLPIKKENVDALKDRLQKNLSTKDIRQTKTKNEKTVAYSLTESVHSDLYYESEEKRLNESLLGNIEDIILSNYSGYKAFIIAEDNQEFSAYLKSKVVLVDTIKTMENDIVKIIGTLEDKNSIPISYGICAGLVSFSPMIENKEIVDTQRPSNTGGISLGGFMEGGVAEQDYEAHMDESALNLGTIISGLPGCGKTALSMLVCRQLLEKPDGRTKVIVISPTEEWDGIGRHFGLSIIKPYASNKKINFFRCCSRLNIEKFYENLAMLLAAASNVGPYKDSLEKCLLAAFRRVYEDARDPDPLEVYEEIEEAVIEQHGKRTNVGVKYTKHGENIRAGLENLRLLLFRPEFSCREGIDFAELMEGSVFDLSCVSNEMKPFFYSLILNQIYSFTETFNNNGDSELRLLLCLEEAQLIFKQDSKMYQSAPTADLKQKIQDFRKKGIGLMLITHNIMDIDQNIRRLCQNKIYFRQSADIVNYALMDLGFYRDDERIFSRLKSLENRVCVLTYVEKINGMARVIGPTFLKTRNYTAPTANYDAEDGYENSTIVMQVKINAKKEIGQIHAKITYLGEVIFKSKDVGSCISVRNIIPGRKYRLLITNEKGKAQKAITIVGNEEIAIDV